MITVLTVTGHYLSGQPSLVVEQLYDLVATGAPSLTSGDPTELRGLLTECERVARYRLHIGPAMANVAAQSLLQGLAEDGLLLIRS
jgi:hypothetical protein